MFRYIPVQERLFSDDIGFYVSYGIRAVKETETEAEEIICISDVCTERDTVDNLTSLCTKLQMDPVHLLDVIEDFLY